MQGDGTLMFALERPGASGDQGIYDDRIELDGIKGRFPLPDVSAQYRRAGKWGHVQLAGIVRQIKWDDMLDDQFDLSGSETGWGENLSSNLKIKDDVLQPQAVYGEGIQNYMNDAPVDVGIETNPRQRHHAGGGQGAPDPWAGGLLRPDPEPQVVPTTVGGSLIDIENSDGQTADAFQRGSYGLVNLLHHPVAGVRMGAELQYGRRDNNSDGWFEDDVRVQFSFRYNFSASIGGK